jgi:hypothetical protein
LDRIGIGKIPFIGEWLSNQAFTGVKESYESNKSNFWTFLLGLLPGGKVLLA